MARRLKILGTWPLPKTTTHLLSNWRLRTKFSAILVKILWPSAIKMNLTLSSAQLTLCPVIRMTSYWARWRLKPPASPLLTQPCIKAQIKENFKAPRHWPSPHKWPVTRKMFLFDDVIIFFTCQVPNLGSVFGSSMPVHLGGLIWFLPNYGPRQEIAFGCALVSSHDLCILL